MPQVDVEYEFDGVILDGDPEGIVDEWLDNAIEDVTDYAWRAVREGANVFKNPTDFYRSRITSITDKDSGLVHDSDVVYGPWLEFGGGQFPGYHLWMDATDDTNKAVDDILEDNMDNAIGDLNA